MCLHTAAGRVGSQLEVGWAGEELPPSRGFRKSKGKKEGKKNRGSMAGSKTQVQCSSGGTSGRKERRSLLWDRQRGLCRSLQDLQKR